MNIIINLSAILLGYNTYKFIHLIGQNEIESSIKESILNSVLNIQLLSLNYWLLFY